MSTFAGGPPPLDRRRPPFALTVRTLLWRTRFLVAASCVGVGASVAADAARPEPPPTVDVVVTTRSIGAGAVVASDDVAVAHLPAGLVPVGSARRAAAVVGSSVAVPLPAGTPLVPGLLVPDDLAGPAGSVVAAVRLADPAVAELLSAGMRVDVLAATPDGGDGEVVASRALVLPAPARTGGGGSWAGGTATDDEHPVLLAVAPGEVKDLAAASAGALLSAVVVP